MIKYLQEDIVGKNFDGDLQGDGTYSKCVGA
jgi:hypothetical protein